MPKTITNIGATTREVSVNIAVKGVAIHNDGSGIGNPGFGGYGVARLRVEE